MSAIVLDCSVSGSWLFEGEVQEPYATAVARAMAEAQALVPIIWPGELASMARQGVRGGRQTREVTQERLAQILRLPIEIDTNPPDSVTLLNAALDWDLTPYDASYLLLAQRHKATLATWDKAMRRAAAKVGVPVFEPAL